MSTTMKKAAAVQSGLVKRGVPSSVALNPAILALLGQLLASLFASLGGGCPTPAKTGEEGTDAEARPPLTPEEKTEAMHNPTMLQKITLRTEIVEGLVQDRQAVLMLARPMFLSILDEAKAMTVEDTKAMEAEMPA